MYARPFPSGGGATGTSRCDAPAFETIQAIVAALADEDYRLAQGLTESHLGFFMHPVRHGQAGTADFPPAYHDLAMAHPCGCRETGSR